jgi:hypothetical protein
MKTVYHLTVLILIRLALKKHQLSLGTGKAVKSTVTYIIQVPANNRGTIFYINLHARLPLKPLENAG